MDLQVIQLSGTAFEQGYKHGQTLSREIAHNLDLYFYRFQNECGLGKDEVLARAKQYNQSIAQRHPTYFEGMKGIVKGSGADAIEIAALNVRYEILYYQYATKGIAEGCTSLAIDRSYSAENHLILAQNWDWFPETKGAIIHTHRLDGLETLAFTEAGIFGGKIGLNSAGIGLLINGLVALEDNWMQLEKPFHVRCHEILQQTQFEQAIGVVTKQRRACSANFMIGSAKSGTVNIEAAPDTVSIVGSDYGYLVHTNHFVDPAALGIHEVEERMHSEHRFNRLCSLLPSNSNVNDDDIKRWLSDHNGHPNSICQHRDPAYPEAEQYVTVVSVILNLDTLTMQVATGQPCVEPYKAIQLQTSYKPTQASLIPS